MTVYYGWYVVAASVRPRPNGARPVASDKPDPLVVGARPGRVAQSVQSMLVAILSCVLRAVSRWKKPRTTFYRFCQYVRSVFLKTHSDHRTFCQFCQ